MDDIHQINDFVLPGDFIDLSTTDDCTIELGPGLDYETDITSFTAYQCGHVKQLKSSTHPTFYIDGHRRYSDLEHNDSVLGIVTRRAIDFVMVDIGLNELASLSLYDFEGSTKRNKPNVDRGDVVYCKVKQINGSQPQLTCITDDGKSDGYGILLDGYLFDIPIETANDLLNYEKETLLKRLGDEIPYEIVIGANGKVWIKASSIRTIIAIRNTILERVHTCDMDTLQNIFATSLVK
ncbi:unnamed protein product [Didymodactylos carnosus]|uniref:K Homology domain-containing protein n=1 Tax=Didymodactylos carnosus TaxID=1234261 RepID=A0A813S2P5_9BILA|nr:unnamed protein product [Didymodactylos carnosus]CAF1590325.1 unnamed protein product [Didymodactylos carnosus]CAF3573436.1 unnamed protein product [Didymodactylos carnosus]CAF4393876.1 unnamed protein product [Didymodactylos carnosus]